MQFGEKKIVLRQIGKDKQKTSVRKEAISRTVSEQNSFWKATLEIFIKM